MHRFQIYFLNNLLIIAKPSDFFDDKVTHFYQHHLSLKWDEILGLFLSEDKLHRIGIETDTSEQCFSEFASFFKPIEAAGGVVFNYENEFVVIERLGMWDLPKGKIEAGETPQTAAVREVMEECGLTKVTLLHPLPSTYHVYCMHSQWFLKTNHWYKMEAPKQDLSPQTVEDITRVFWLPFSDHAIFYDKTYPSLRPLIEYLRTE